MCICIYKYLQSSDTSSFLSDSLKVLSPGISARKNQQRQALGGWRPGNAPEHLTVPGQFLLTWDWGGHPSYTPPEERKNDNGKIHHFEDKFSYSTW